MDGARSHERLQASRSVGVGIRQLVLLLGVRDKIVKFRTSAIVLDQFPSLYLYRAQLSGESLVSTRLGP